MKTLLLSLLLASILILAKENDLRQPVSET